IYTQDIELQFYSIENNQLVKEYTKIISHKDYDVSSGSREYRDPRMPKGIVNGGYIRTFLGEVKILDFDGDGISEIVWNFPDRHCQFIPIKEENKGVKAPDLSVDDVEDIGNYKEECYFYNRNIVINTAPELSIKQSLSGFPSYGNRKIEDHKIGDFDGDGKMDFISFDSGGRPIIIRTEKDSDTQRFVSNYKNFYREQKGLDGLVSHAFTGDFNGDGKTDLLIPAGTITHDWKLYLSTGTEFKEENNLKFPYDPAPHLYQEGGREYYYGRHYFVQDINGDGKADFVIVGTHSRKNRYSTNHYTEFVVKYYENTGSNKNGKIDFQQKNIDGHANRIHEFSRINVGLRSYPFTFTNSNGVFETSYPSPDGHISTPHRFGALSPMVGTHYINNSNHQILLMHQEGGVMVKFSSYELNKTSRISAITQGGLRTEVDYKELDPVSTKDPHFYAPVKQEKYPYMELEKVSQSYAVSQLRQIISPSQTRKQDFRYRGFVTHLQGKGMIGFRKTARSSWYADGFENTKVWSGAEIDPLNEGLPIKEWSIKTNDETQIFPKDVSLNNQSLLSFKSTQYKVDRLVNGIKVSALSQEDKPKAVIAIVPTEVTTKDFIKETTSIDRVEYNELYLPVKTISSTNNGFAEKTTQIEYYPANLSAEGKDYSVGRPRVKTELVRAYGDSKGAKEEYHYENNLLKSLTTYNRDNSGWLKESYEYDGFGNITTKTISNSVDSNTQTSKTEYEDKGRFVIKKTDNLGLITLITYNDWGQVLTQKDPQGNNLTNTYDSWGKLLSISTNLGGTKTITYEKLNNHDVKTTEYSPDGGIGISFTNKIGQTYKSTAKVFGKNQYASKEVHYDALGRKIKESEAYLDDASASQWNTIEYDEYSRPIKATAFTGKIVETKYTKNTVTATETNANNRFKKQTFDALGNITSTEDKGGIIEFKYNAAGEVIEAKYGTNIVTTKYDAWGRKIEYHDPSNGLYKYEYHHGFGLLTKEISPKGFKEYTYNDKGQLISQKEKSNKQGVTDKEIHFAYNDKGMLLSKIGSSKGKAFSSHIAYDKYGRVIAASEESFGKKYERKNVVYDPIGRVHSYEKSLTSSGKTTNVVIENVYDSWSGTMYQLKDNSSGKVLWELEELTAKGKILKAKLGGTSIQNTYDTNDFLSTVNHSSKKKSNLLLLSYSFNAIKNELNHRSTGGDFNIIENFVYDDNNRFINWTNPRTGELHHNVYDKQGRIIENDQLGKIKFENKDKVYQPTGMSLNEKGAELLKNNLIQKIEYNENNDPVFIDGVKGDVRFEYGLTAMRQMMTFGGEFLSENASQNEVSHGKFSRFYSEDGSFEVTLDHQSGKEKHILYIGGNPYESEIIFVKDFKEEKGSYKFLHKDYLGSILAISDEEGNKLEQRHYDAWGNLTHLQIGNGEVITDPEQIAKAQLLLDRGYTSHEHLWEVGIIHMNGRLYDPLLRRFLNADENIQDPHNTQNYNKYGYVMNNPLMYSDPSGEFFQFLFIGPLLMKAIIIGAAVGLASYTVGLAVTGNLHQWSIGGALKSTFWGAVGGAVSFGVGEIFSVASEAAKGIEKLTKVAEVIKKAGGDFGLALVQAGTHAVSQGILAVVQGDSFLSAAAGGFFGSLGAKAWGGAMKNLGYEKFAQSTIGTVAFGALSGGIGAELSGGNFWQGAVTGGIVAGLNHSLHKMNSTDLINGQEQNQQKDPWDLDGNGELNLHEANNWYRNGNGKDIILDASKIDLNFVDTSGWRKGDIKGIQTLFRSRNGTVLGNITVKYHGNNVVSILPDVYDFESHPKSPIRNLATKLGKWKAGEGIPYKIIFRGKNVIGSKTYRQ
ncbi:MAG: RHS repeat-associated core domain-containing protein, partial [Flavobacteriaceae bacterium]